MAAEKGVQDRAKRACTTIQRTLAAMLYKSADTLLLGNINS
jgi:hypothetical protein